ncbi:hypothetical protein LXT21_40785 [Myxococcus sp. K38C18041901]|uniref:hypothetical protein n=1 Tax=Myxococcus guangdongensis TaxID=2906760 RepID=UPI0020A767FE|nr:hypothetical protein [Myxococcus guangdongensis]MCP3065128.1 hypothetical protein [Myxococcus guangdongensis]
MNRHSRMVLGWVCTLVGLSAWAGSKRDIRPVVIEGTYLAYGTLSTARNSSDPVQYMGCGIATFDSGYSIVSCTAVSSAGQTLICTSVNPHIIETARAINGDSYIMFYVNTEGTCTSLTVMQSSGFEPKQP